MKLRRILGGMLAAVLLLAAGAVMAENPVIVRCGGSFCYALDANGVIWGWGDNQYGQLGNGNKHQVNWPQPVATGLDGSHVADIRCGNQSVMFLMDDGTVYTCGNNNNGQQGNFDIKGVNKQPRQVPNLTGIVSIATGFGQCAAVDKDGHLWMWGRNTNGQIGNGTKQSAPRPVMLDLQNVVAVSCGGKYTIATCADGTVYGFGENEWGTLTDITRYKDVLTPTELPNVSHRFTQIACGGDAAYGLDADGKVWAWGRNDYWQLGTPDTDDYQKTMQVVQVQIPEDVVIVELFAYNSHTAALDDQGRLWVWGSSSEGQLGNGTNPHRSLPLMTTHEDGIRMGAVGSLCCAYLTNNDEVYCTGYNKYGQVGTRNNRRTVITQWSDTCLNLRTGIWQDPGR